MIRLSDEDFEKKKRKLFEDLESSSELNGNLEERIEDLYGGRGKRAIDVVKNDGVRREDGRWYVQGREDEYEVVKTHCSCYDYVLNIVTGKADVDMCYHALAKNIQELLESS